MLAIVDEIEREGFKVLDQTVYLKPFMPKVGVLKSTANRRTMGGYLLWL